MQRDETSTFTKFFDPTIYSTQSLISNQLPFTTISQTETVFNSGPTSSLPLEFSQNQHWNINAQQQQQQQSQLLSQQTKSADNIKPTTMTNTNDLEHDLKSQSQPFSIVSDRQKSDISPSSTLSANNDIITNCIDKPLSTITSADNNSKELIFS